MIGNVWEWCHSLYKPYPYEATDGRESETDSVDRVLRGGAFYLNWLVARAAYRNYFHPDYRSSNVGLRVVVAPNSRF